MPVEKEYNVLNYSIYAIVNDAYLKLDGDTAPVKVDSIPYQTAIRLLRGVLRKVLKYRKWSFMRCTHLGQEGDNCIGEYVKVLRVYDSGRRPLHQVNYANELPPNTYYIWKNKLTTGRLVTDDKKITIEVQIDNYDITDPEQEVDFRLYDILVLGLCAELCKIDQGGFQAMAGEREADFQHELDTTAKQDMLESKSSIMFDETLPVNSLRGPMI